MGSFKLKLVSYFVLLTLVPVVAALWGFDQLTRRSETRRADARLQAGLRTALNGYQYEVDALDRSGAKLAAYPPFQRALRDRDRPALRGFAAVNGNVLIRAGGVAIGTPPPANAVRRPVTVVAKNTLLGEVVAWFRVDRAFLDRVTARAGIESDDTLLLVRNGRVDLGPETLLGDRVPTATRGAEVVRLGGTRYRLLTTLPLSQPRGVTFAMLTPQAAIDGAARRSERMMIVVLVASLLLAGFVAYFLSRSIVGTLGRLADAAQAIAAGRLGERVAVRGRDEFGQLVRAFNAMAAQLEARMVELESERSRLSRATGRIGEALAATLDTEQLLTVLVESAVEATGAQAGYIRGGDRRNRAVVGEPPDGAELLELPLRAGRRTFGTLVLAGGSFGPDESETAASLAAQAVIALENARLHRIVEQQALVDGLTGLANRRSAEELLRAELTRTERYGGELALVLADLDNFKAINDRYGHPAGDAVLREFARRLKQTVREVDLAARWGGEEFCLILPGSDATGGTHVAERAREALEARPVSLPDGTEIAVTASFGVAALPDAVGEGGLLDAADAALYRAKDLGKNRVETAAHTVGRA
jgi:diguanylate cyclase (GGDEF)-like protein